MRERATTGRAWRRWASLFALILVLATGLSPQPAPRPATSAPVSDETRQGLAVAYGKLPLTFEANRGQTDKQVHFLSRGSGYTLFLTPGEAVLSLRRPTSPLRIADCGLRIAD